MKGLISKKTTLHLQHTFLVHFFANALHDYNLKLPSLYTFYWGNIICIPVRFFCSVGMWGHTNFVRKYQAGAACLAKPILRKKTRLFCSLRSWERRLSSQAKKSLSKLNAETSLWTGLWSSGELGGVLTYWSRSVLCCGTQWGRPFSTSVQPSKTCLESRGLSLDENFRAREGGKEKTSLFFLLPMVSLRSKRFCSS